MFRRLGPIITRSPASPVSPIGTGGTYVPKKRKSRKSKPKPKPVVTPISEVKKAPPKKAEVKKAIAPTSRQSELDQQRTHFKRLEQQAARKQPVKRIQVPRESSLFGDLFKRKDVTPKSLIKKQKKVKAWQQKPIPKSITDFFGKAATLRPVNNKIIQAVFNTDGTVTKNRAALTSFSNYVSKEIKSNPDKIVMFAALPPALRIAGAGAKAAGITKIITKVPKGELIARRTIQVVSTVLGVAYTKDVYDRVTEKVITGYKDGKTTTSEKKLKNGTTEVTTSTTQIPQFRKPTRQEQVERMGGIFATELAPLSISHSIVNRGVQTGYKPQPKPKPKVKKTTKIKKAGKIISAVVLLSVLPAPKQKLIVKPKLKPKVKPKVKTTVKPKVKTVNLMKDPKAMSQLTRAKTSMAAVNRVASQKQIYKVQQTQKLTAQAKQHQKIIAQKQALINSRATASQKKIQATIDSIKVQLSKGQNAKLLKSQLLKLKAEAASKQKAEINALLKQIDAYIAAEAKASTKITAVQLTKLKAEAKGVLTQKQKTSLLNKSNTLLKQHVKLKSILLLYSRQSQTPIQKQRIKSVVTLISKQIGNVKATQKVIQNIKVKPALRVPTKKLPVSKRVPVRRTPPRRPVKKPVVTPVIVPVIPVIPLKRKAKATKKKKKSEVAYVSWFVKNNIPTLKTLYGL